MVAFHSCYFSKKAQIPCQKGYPEELKTLGDYLRKTRLDRNLSQPQVARVIGVTTDTITNWELNRNTPEAKQAAKIISFIGCVPQEWGRASLRERLYYARQVKGVTHRQLAKELKIDASTIGATEAEKRNPSKKTTLKIKYFIETALKSH